MTIARSVAASVAKSVASSAVKSGGGGSTPLLLDTYTGSIAAYSLRKLRTAYSSSSYRVRRSSDNAEQDIGFSGVSADTASLQTFVGAGDGFAATLYDQSTNAKNATQSTTTNQANVATSGVANDLTFDGVNDFFSSASTDYLTVFTLSAWVKPTSGSVMGVLGRATAGLMDGNYWIRIGSAGATAGFYSAGAYREVALAATANVWNHVALTYDGANLLGYVNGSQTSSLAYAGAPSNAGTFAVGRPGAFAGQYFSGSMRDVLVFPSALSSGQVAAIYALGST